MNSNLLVNSLFRKYSLVFFFKIVFFFKNNKKSPLNYSYKHFFKSIGYEWYPEGRSVHCQVLSLCLECSAKDIPYFQGSSSLKQSVTGSVTSLVVASDVKASSVQHQDEQSGYYFYLSSHSSLELTSSSRSSSHPATDLRSIAKRS